MRRRFAVLFLVLMAALASVAGPAVADASDVKIYEGNIAGAEYRVEVPAGWNGTLLLWSHGLYPAPFLPEEIELTNTPATKQWLLGHGYALAASSYRTPNGWSVKEALGDQIALLDWFADTIGQPRRTVSAGTSMGGLIAVLLAERNPHRFDGVASLCGPLAGGLGLWNTALDVNFAIKTLLAPGSDIELTDVADPDRTVAQVREILDEALKTPQGRARLALAASFGPIPGWSRAFQPRPTDVVAQVRQQTDDWLGRFLLGITWGGVRADLEQRAGGNPTWNVGVDYRRQLAHSSERRLVRRAYREAGLSVRADLNRLAAAPRIRPDAGATAYLARYGTPRGRTPSPVITVHTVADAVAPEHQRAYAAQVRRSGDPNSLRQLFVGRAGHCLFTPAEEIVTYRTLLTRIDTGHWPRTPPPALNTAARELGTGYHQLYDWIADESGVATPAFVRHQPGQFLR